MAILSNDKTYVTVQKGDTLWGIARDYLGSGSKYQQLASINNLADPDRLVVGQKIKLTKTPSDKTAAFHNARVNITAFGLQSNTENTLYVTWTWARENTSGYMIEWSYDTGDDIWFIGSSTTTTHEPSAPDASRQSTYSIPSNAKRVRVRIKPISKTYTKNDTETHYWFGEWSSYQLYTDETPLPTPSVPTIEIDKYKLTAKLENIPGDSLRIEFQIYKDNTFTVYKTGSSFIGTARSTSYSCTVDAGGEYRVRCRAAKGSTYSEWTEFSNPVTTIPAASSGITTIKAKSKTSVYLEWGSVDTATSYDVEYTTKKDYFDNSDQTTIKTGIEYTHYEITGLESGQEYFFRVRAVNGKGDSSWSDVESVVIGKKPSAPTTWSSTTTGISGEELTLYWIHNAEDGSSQTYAELELYVNGVKETHTITSTPSTDEGADDDEVSAIQSYVIDTTVYIEGTKIQWRVRTAGITKEYSDWSIQRTVDIYAPPTLELDVTNIDGDSIEVLESFPFYIYGLPGPKTQTPIGYHVLITSEDSYVTVDNIGNEKVVNAGDEVYSKYFDTSGSLLLEMSANNIDLENNANYTITCTVSMNSGLTAISTKRITVSWTDDTYSPNAEIGYDNERYVTHIRPYCMEYRTAYCRVEYDFTKEYITTDEELDESTIDRVYTDTGETVHIGKDSRGLELYYCILYTDEYGNPIEKQWRKVNYSSGVYTVTNEKLDISTITKVFTSEGNDVYIGVNPNGDELYYTITEISRLTDDITLSVYRREYDGSFTELATGLSNTSNTYVTDPHPALDYARYRVVAVTNDTGAVSYYDVPGYYIGEIGVIIQWDEVWSSFDTTNNDELVQPPWSGSLLRLPYNIDVSDSNDLDVTLVNYIGRKRPISYYGTHLGEKSTWNVVIPKSDKETLYALRRLAIWTGDVYVREPSGSGYWANISVSFSQKHCEVTIPVTFDITRVEGGV